MATNRKWILTHTGLINLDDLRGFYVGMENADVMPGDPPRLAFYIAATHRHNLSGTTDSTKLLHLGTIPKPAALAKPNNYAFREDAGFQRQELEGIHATAWPKGILSTAQEMLERLANFIADPEVQVLYMNTWGPCYNINSLAVSVGDDPTGEAETLAVIESRP